MNGFSFTLTLYWTNRTTSGNHCFTNKNAGTGGWSKTQTSNAPVSHYYQPNDKRKLYNYVIKTAWHSYKYIGTDQHKQLATTQTAPQPQTFISLKYNYSAAPSPPRIHSRERPKCNVGSVSTKQD